MRRARSIEAIRRLVVRILEQMEIRTPPIPIERVAQHLGAVVKRSPFDGELAGVLVRKDATQPLIGVNSSHHRYRQRFTIAHECGHLVLHSGEMHVDRHFRINRRDERSGLAVDPEEIEANRFAAEVLMPSSMIELDLANKEIDVEDEEDIRSLAKRYQVSVQAMTHRISNLFPAIS